MILEGLFQGLCWGWLAAAALDTVTVAIRSRGTGGWVRDHGAQLLPWLLMIAALIGSDWVRQIAPGSICGAAPWLRPLSLVIWVAGKLRFMVGAIGFAGQAAVAENRVGNALTGVARAELLHSYRGSEILPKPERVMIQDFTRVGAVVMDDDHRYSLFRHGSDEEATPEALIRQIQDSFAKTLMEQFKRVNMESDRVPHDCSAVGPALIIQGECIAVNQGSARKRIIVGFGHGASEIKARCIISLLEDGKRTVLLDSHINARSGKKPGAILTTSVTSFATGLASGYLGDKQSSTVQAGASRMAKLVGKQTKAVMLAQKWIPAA
jgi:hypothetical protein